MLLVDTFNVLHVTGVLPPALAGLDVGELADLIRASRYGRQRVLLVCDGAAPRGQRASSPPDGGPIRLPAGAGVHVVFAGGGQEADAAIEAILGREHFRGGSVVSSDERVQRAARRARMGVLPSERFLRLLASDYEVAETRARRLEPRPAFATDLPLDRLSVGKWLAAMGVDPALAEEVGAAARSLPARPSPRPSPVAAAPRTPPSGPRPASPAVRPARPAHVPRDEALAGLLREYGLEDAWASLENDQWAQMTSKPADTRARDASGDARRANSGARRRGRPRP